MRHYMNIDGAVRRLALFEPPIDPALLVRAAAAGIDMREGYDPELAGPRMVGHIRVDPDGSRVRCQEWSSSGDAGPSSRGGGTLQAGLLVGGLGASHAATSASGARAVPGSGKHLNRGRDHYGSPVSALELVPLEAPLSGDSYDTAPCPLVPRDVIDDRRIRWRGARGAA